MVRNFYNCDIDRSLAYAISKYGQYVKSQRKLKWIIESEEYLGRIIPGKTFRYHITKMLNAGYIFNNKGLDWRRGKSSSMCLSSEILDQINLGNLIIYYDNDDRLHTSSYTKIKKQNKREEKRLNVELKRGAIYYIIMRVMSIETPYSHSKPHGFSITDIIKGRLDGHAFWYLNLDKYRTLVEDCIQKLRKENIVKGTELSIKEEPRYELADPMWKDFVIDCEELLENTIMHRLHLVWNNIRRPNLKERAYYELCYGEKHTDTHMGSIYNNAFEKKRNKMPKKTKRRSKRRSEDEDEDEDEITRLLRLLDNVIVKHVEEFKQKYYDLVKRHPYLYNKIIETVCPIFLQIEAKRTISNPKNQNKKYHPFIQVHIKETSDPNAGGEKITFR